jgi:hypothetical protein
VYLATGHGGDTVHLQSFPGAGYTYLIDAGFTDNPKGNTFIGPDDASLTNTWLLDGQTPYAAGLVGPAPHGGVTFELFEHIVGGAGSNEFRFSVPWGVVSSIDGRGSQNTLDYSRFTGGNVIVDLPLGQATGVSGGVSGIQSVIGASGGPAGTYNILVGDGGSDHLTGGNGRRNLLIAGARASTLVGGDGEDILIAGTTDYDTNVTALQDIMSVWAGPGTYLERRQRLVFDPTYAFSLNAGTVHSNDGHNSLKGKPNGSSAHDLYFADLGQMDTTDAIDPAVEIILIS